MRILSLLLAVCAIAAIALKLFTYEFYLKDDPTSGVALRSTPSFLSLQPLQTTGSATDHILVSDENGFVADSLYRALVNWGWLVLCIAWTLISLQVKRSQKKPELTKA